MAGGAEPTWDDQWHHAGVDSEAVARDSEGAAGGGNLVAGMEAEVAVVVADSGADVELATEAAAEIVGDGPRQTQLRTPRAEQYTSAAV